MTHIFEVPFDLSLVSTKHPESRLRNNKMRGYLVEPIMVGEIFVLAGSAIVEGADLRYFHTSVVLNVEVIDGVFLLHTQNSVYRVAPCDPTIDISRLDMSLDIELVRKVYDACLSTQGEKAMADAVEDLLVENYSKSELVKDDAFISALAARSQVYEHLFKQSMAAVAKEHMARKETLN